MGRLRTSLLALSPVAIGLLAAACVTVEPAVVQTTGDDGGGTDASHPKADSGHDTGTDGTTADAKHDGKGSSDAGSDGHVVAEDAGEDSAHDAGVDAVGICNTTVNAGGAAPGSTDLSFENGAKGALMAASAGQAVLDGTGLIYIVGSRANCVSASSSGDFAVSRFTANGAIDTTYGTDGTVCVDFGDTTDGAASGALDASGNLVVVGLAYTVGSTATATVAIARLTPSGALDTTFGNGTGRVRPTLETTTGTCSLGSGCAPPEAQQATAVAFNAAASKFYVVGTTQSYNGNYYSAGFIGAFNSDGTPDGSFNPSGLHPNAKFGASGYVTDDGLSAFDAIAVDASGNLVVVGTDQGAVVDGGFAEEGRKFVTRRYTIAGALDPSFHHGGETPGEIRTSPGTNDYAEAVAIDPLTQAILVGGSTSVGGTSTNAGVFGGGFAGVVRYTSAGELDTSFGTGGFYVSTSLQDFPAYSHFIVAVQCDQRVLLGGFTGLISGCSGGVGCQTMGVQRLTAAGAADTTYGPADAGGVITVPFTSENVVTSGVTLNPAEDALVYAGDQSGNLIFERFHP